ncbi:AAA family ATPase [Phycicoccus sp. CSK15P-2]|uniref:AAA family ATPase n=1 Tax=Phycicoccus sp. CSK15P-2 TaxID=2807627 RepID=UPI0019522F6F|nr:AAA family ATPase [Phycicoccus sp. CSK15P-2]MBM6405506.1 AAA family ATPase [Phycicoccus sp. CSK15P-2]
MSVEETSGSIQDQRQPRLVQVAVTKLLGTFDHTIDFPADQEFVIIFGPNGVGKTRLLELMRAAVGMKSFDLLHTPFSLLRLRFDDGSKLEFVKPEGVEELPLQLAEDDADAEEPTGRVCEVTLTRADGSEEGHVIRTAWDARFERWLEVATSWTQIDSTMWRDSTDGEVLSTGELYERLSRVYWNSPPGRATARRRRMATVPDGIKDFTATVPIHLIETQRLMAMPKPTSREPWEDVPPVSYVSTVTQHSDDLRAQLSHTVTSHSRLSQQLDRTFPKRIIENQDKTSSDKMIREQYQAQNELRERLATFSLIDAQGEVELPANELGAFEIKALSTYLDDTEQKLAVFTGLLERLELFVKIMNARLVRKTVTIDVNKGISVRSKETNALIPSESLSSGEQHEMVLLYDLLFRTDPNSVVLIDEPEISLHVAWQQQFLSDILEIARLSELRFVVATHSPQIIDTWWERTNELTVD